MADEEIELVYDDQCPVCRTYCKNVSLDDSSLRLLLVDARKNSATMDDITAYGLDIDEGMVLKTGGKLYYGSDAMHQIALRAKKHGWVGWVNRLFFGTRGMARIFYPAGKVARNLVLRLAGIEKIKNLEKKPRP